MKLLLEAKILLSESWHENKVATLLSVLLVVLGFTGLLTLPGKSIVSSKIDNFLYGLNTSPVLPIFSSREYLQNPRFLFHYKNGKTRDLLLYDFLKEVYEKRFPATIFWHFVKFHKRLPDFSVTHVIRETLCGGKLHALDFQNLSKIQFYKVDGQGQNLEINCD